MSEIQAVPIQPLARLEPMRLPGGRLRAPVWLLWAVLLISIARMWLAPLPSSFWVDEMGTRFVIEHGAADPTLRVAPQVPNSIYFVLPRLAEKWFGPSEVADRLPSTVALGLALFFIAAIAGRLIHPAAGWFTAFTCLALHEFNFQAADARPYALGTCVAAASLWFLVRWLDTARWRDAAGFAVLAALVWRVHLIFWPCYVLFFLYTVVRLARGETRVSWLRAPLVYAAIGATLIPVLFDALALARDAGAHVVAPEPTPGDFGPVLKPTLILGLCAAAALLARWFEWPRVRRAARPEAMVLIFGWWLASPVCLFAFSHLTGNSVFLERYMYLALPGAALMATLGAASFLPARQWRSAALALGLANLVFLGHWNRLWPDHTRSDWRGAARAVNALSSGAEMPIVCPSPFIEARSPVWQPQYPLDSFLYSQLSAYPVRGAEFPFPFDLSPAAEADAAQLAHQSLAPSGHFVLYGPDIVTVSWETWFSARPELAGWRIRRVGPFGDVQVIEFEKTDLVTRTLY